MKEAKEIDFAIDYIKDIRQRFVAEIRAKEKELGEGVITEVARKMTNGICELETKEITSLKERLAKL